MKIGRLFTAIVFTMGISGAICSLSYGQMPKEKIQLQGDANFKAEILRTTDDTIAANSLFVATNGSDGNNGTVDKPFATVQKALDTVQAGQTIYVRGGTYNGLYTFSTSGSEGKYITLRNYPNETPYLTCSGASGAILGLEGCDYIKIEGLEIGGMSAEIAQGILLNSDENHVIIRNNNIHNLMTTKPNENEEGEANGILCYGEGTTEEKSINNICIENNNVHHNTTGWCESVSTAGNCKYINVINNTVHDNTNIGIDFYGNAKYCKNEALDQPRYCVAAGNTVYNSICSYAECAGLYVDGARDTVLENNIIYGSMYGIEIGSEERNDSYPVKNIIARNNLVYNNNSGGIRVGGYDKTKTGYVTATKIYNNTLVNNGSGEGGWNGELCFVKCNGIDVRNNLVYKDSTEYPLVGGDLAESYVLNVAFNQNVFYSPAGADELSFEFQKKKTTGIAAFNTQVGGVNTYGKPTLKADYSLASGSYGIDIGDSSVLNNDMGSAIDLVNNYRGIGSAIDVGAFEYQDGSQSTVSTISTTTTEPTTETTTYAKADLNKDGEINDMDCATLLKMICGVIDKTENADLNNDGNINLLDALTYLGNKVWNYTTGENSNFFSVSANPYNKAVSFKYNGITLSKAIKMESDTKISFTATKDGTLTLVADGSSGNKIKVNGKSYGINPKGAITVAVKAGANTVAKDSSSTYLYYMSFK